MPNGRPKALWVRPLRPDACGALCAAELPPECRRGADSDAYGVLPLPEPLVGSLKPVVRHCGKLTQRQRVALGLPRFDRKGGGNYRKTPGYTAFYSLLRQLPPDDFAAVLGAWIRAHEGGLPRQLALR